MRRKTRFYSEMRAGMAFEPANSRPAFEKRPEWAYGTTPAAGHRFGGACVAVRRRADARIGLACSGMRDITGRPILADRLDEIDKGAQLGTPWAQDPELHGQPSVLLSHGAFKIRS